MTFLELARLTLEKVEPLKMAKVSKKQASKKR